MQINSEDFPNFPENPRINLPQSHESLNKFPHNSIQNDNLSQFFRIIDF